MLDTSSRLPSPPATDLDLRMPISPASTTSSKAVSCPISSLMTPPQSMFYMTTTGEVLMPVFSVPGPFVAMPTFEQSFGTFQQQQQQYHQHQIQHWSSSMPMPLASMPMSYSFEEYLPVETIIPAQPLPSSIPYFANNNFAVMEPIAEPGYAVQSPTFTSSPINESEPTENATESSAVIIKLESTAPSTPTEPSSKRKHSPASRDSNDEPNPKRIRPTTTPPSPTPTPTSSPILKQELHPTSPLLTPVTPPPLRKRASASSPYTCPFPSCPKTFTRKSHLVSHTITHTKTKNHTCEQCGSAYARLHDLQRHIKTAHVPGGGRFRCGRCGIECSRKDSLAKHLKVNCKGPVEAA
ncbi:hypothetical protein HDU97_002822 [Phlyctochytrium planicorne]|nr:hypothetical protein HDU97_002822 [Phlyctochytrium planicorne]